MPGLKRGPSTCPSVRRRVCPSDVCWFFPFPERRSETTLWDIACFHTHGQPLGMYVCVRVLLRLLNLDLLYAAARHHLYFFIFMHFLLPLRSQWTHNKSRHFDLFQLPSTGHIPTRDCWDSCWSLCLLTLKMKPPAWAHSRYCILSPYDT